MDDGNPMREDGRQIDPGNVDAALAWIRDHARTHHGCSNGLRGQALVEIARAADLALQVRQED